MRISARRARKARWNPGPAWITAHAGMTRGERDAATWSRVASSALRLGLAADRRRRAGVFRGPARLAVAAAIPRPYRDPQRPRSVADRHGAEHAGRAAAQPCGGAGRGEPRLDPAGRRDPVPQDVGQSGRQCHAPRRAGHGGRCQRRAGAGWGRAGGQRRAGYRFRGSRPDLWPLSARCRRGGRGFGAGRGDSAPNRRLAWRAAAAGIAARGGRSRFAVLFPAGISKGGPRRCRLRPGRG